MNNNWLSKLSISTQNYFLIFNDFPFSSWHWEKYIFFFFLLFLFFFFSLTCRKEVITLKKMIALILCKLQANCNLYPTWNHNIFIFKLIFTLFIHQSKKKTENFYFNFNIWLLWEKEKKYIKKHTIHKILFLVSFNRCNNVSR
jgi:hypothetical protein